MLEKNPKIDQSNNLKQSPKGEVVANSLVSPDSELKFPNLCSKKILSCQEQLEYSENSSPSLRMERGFDLSLGQRAGEGNESSVQKLSQTNSKIEIVELRGMHQELIKEKDLYKLVIMTEGNSLVSVDFRGIVAVHAVEGAILKEEIKFSNIIFLTPEAINDFENEITSKLRDKSKTPLLVDEIPLTPEVIPVCFNGFKLSIQDGVIWVNPIQEDASFQILSRVAEYTQTKLVSEASDQELVERLQVRYNLEDEIAIKMYETLSLIKKNYLRGEIDVSSINEIIDLKLPKIVLEIPEMKDIFSQLGRRLTFQFKELGLAESVIRYARTFDTFIIPEYVPGLVLREYPFASLSIDSINQHIKDFGITQICKPASKKANPNIRSLSLEDCQAIQVNNQKINVPVLSKNLGDIEEIVLFARANADVNRRTDLTFAFFDEQNNLVCHLIAYEGKLDSENNVIYVSEFASIKPHSREAGQVLQSFLNVLLDEYAHVDTIILRLSSTSNFQLTQRNIDKLERRYGVHLKVNSEVIDFDENIQSSSTIVSIKRDK